MISANEKEFMMVAQFLADRMRSSEERLNNIALMQEGQNPTAPQDPAQETSALDEALEESPVQALPDVENFEELAALAREAGYTTSYRADDLLSEEELARLDAEYEQIEKDFAQATKLNKTDAGFITIAIALQVMRQVLQPKLKSAVTSAAAEGSPRAQLASIGHVSHSGPGPITGLLKMIRKSRKRQARTETRQKNKSTMHRWPRFQILPLLHLMTRSQRRKTAAGFFLPANTEHLETIHILAISSAPAIS
ncbi:MAG: hypothetical protein J6M46_04230 [Lachnospiraceae bacterium]|nr:hypothetical protein [Lachnospiraceae bacterium]